MHELTRKQFLGAMAGAAAATGALANLGAAQEAGKTTPNIKWSFMGHWSTITARGPINPYNSVKYMDRQIKQLQCVGFTGFDSFTFRLANLARVLGGWKAVLKFVQDRGMEKIVGLFASTGDGGHVRSEHERIIRSFQQTLDQIDGIGVENFVVMPLAAYWQVEPITDEKIKIVADLWNKVGELSIQRGVKLSCHHEFWGGIQSWDTLDKFYSWTDPRYVFYYCDAAQHAIVGVDPVKVYMKYHDRCSGFHFKDSHNVDTKGEYRMPPDPECIAPSVTRWFWEPGTPQGIVDFPALMKAMKEYKYKGWCTLENDKADVSASIESPDAVADYASSTCYAKWYFDNVLAKIYS